VDGTGGLEWAICVCVCVRNPSDLLDNIPTKTFGRPPISCQDRWLRRKVIENGGGGDGCAGVGKRDGDQNCFGPFNPDTDQVSTYISISTARARIPNRTRTETRGAAGPTSEPRHVRAPSRRPFVVIAPTYLVVLF
jgi:hypothetical protein